MNDLFAFDIVCWLGSNTEHSDLFGNCVRAMWVRNWSLGARHKAIRRTDNVMVDGVDVYFAVVCWNLCILCIWGSSPRCVLLVKNNWFWVCEVLFLLDFLRWIVFPFCLIIVTLSYDSCAFAIFFTEWLPFYYPRNRFVDSECFPLFHLADLAASGILLVLAFLFATQVRTTNFSLWSDDISTTQPPFNPIDLSISRPSLARCVSFWRLVCFQLSIRHDLSMRLPAKRTSFNATTAFVWRATNCAMASLTA